MRLKLTTLAKLPVKYKEVVVTKTHPIEHYNGYNEAIDEISTLESREITISRKKLSDIIQSWESYKDGIKKVSPEHYYLMSSLTLADAIIHALPELIEIGE